MGRRAGLKWAQLEPGAGPAATERPEPARPGPSERRAPGGHRVDPLAGADPQPGAKLHEAAPSDRREASRWAPEERESGQQQRANQINDTQRHSPKASFIWNRCAGGQAADWRLVGATIGLWSLLIVCVCFNQAPESVRAATSGGRPLIDRPQAAAAAPREAALLEPTLAAPESQTDSLRPLGRFKRSRAPEAKLAAGEPRNQTPDAPAGQADEPSRPAGGSQSQAANQQQQQHPPATRHLRRPNESLSGDRITASRMRPAAGHQARRSPRPPSQRAATTPVAHWRPMLAPAGAGPRDRAKASAALLEYPAPARQSPTRSPRRPQQDRPGLAGAGLQPASGSSNHNKNSSNHNKNNTNNNGQQHGPQQQQRRPRLHPAAESAASSAPSEFRWPRRAYQWRRKADSRLYKRVLLCEKTLVSLDYLRSQPGAPLPPNELDLGGLRLGGELAPTLDEIFNEIGDFDDQLLDQLDERPPSGALELASRRQDQDQVQDHQLQPDASLALTGEPNSTSVAGGPMLAAEPSGPEPGAGEPAESGRRRWPSPLPRRKYLSDHDDDTLIKCDMWDLEKGLKSRRPSDEVLRVAVRADFETVREAINRCRQLSERSLAQQHPGPGLATDADQRLELMSTEDLVSLFSMKRGLIPGTKWCGLGDQANSYNDLGPKYRIDICCRAHDHCPIRSKPFRNNYGVLNIGLYTKSHCDCDADFYRCLREVRSRTADMLGNLYFNVMKLQCMREERLKVCREMKPIALGFERCIRYEDSPIKRVFKFTTPPVAY